MEEDWKELDYIWSVYKHQVMQHFIHYPLLVLSECLLTFFKSAGNSNCREYKTEREKKLFSRYDSWHICFYEHCWNMKYTLLGHVTEDLRLDFVNMFAYNKHLFHTENMICAIISLRNSQQIWFLKRKNLDALLNLSQVSYCNTVNIIL